MTYDKITVHCSASPNGVNYSARIIKKDHIARGFRDIGYHYIIQPSGQIERGREENQVGAHVKEHNYHNLGICLVGTDRFTLAQFNELRLLCLKLQSKYHIKPWNIFGHHDFNPEKDCPNMRATNLYAWINQELTAAIDSYLLLGNKLERSQDNGKESKEISKKDEEKGLLKAPLAMKLPKINTIEEEERE